MVGFKVLGEILYELRAIRTLLEGGKNIPLPPLEEGEDASSVSFTDDVKAVLREEEEERFYALRGRYPVAGERTPGPLSPSGRNWNEASQEEVERYFNGEEVGEGG
jgi:hypothetical protein